MNLPHPRRPSRLVAAALAALSLTAQANGSTLRLAPGLHVFDTPQVFGPDDVLELVLAGGLGCDPCHTQLMFQNTVHFDGTLRLTLDDSFIPWGGHWIWLFLYRGIPDVPGTAQLLAKRLPPA